MISSLGTEGNLTASSQAVVTSLATTHPALTLSGTCVGFSPNSLILAVLNGGRLQILRRDGSQWGAPTFASPSGRTVLTARFAPNSSTIAVAVSAVTVPAPALAWTLVDDVIIDVINKVRLSAHWSVLSHLIL